MTFYEAALRVLESEGRPLHFAEITEKSIAQDLLSHVGKTPEQTMLSRLAAMARRTRERRVMVTAKDTFALVEWALTEDAEALAQAGVVEPHPEELLPPLRGTERHPEPRTENQRVAGRGSERKRRRDEDEDGTRGKRRRFPPIPEISFELLSDSTEGLTAGELIVLARSRELAGEDLSLESLLTSLLEDNLRRIDAGRRPQFVFSKETGKISLERAGSPSEAPPLELQAAFAAALGIPLEGGRPVLARSSAPARASESAMGEAASAEGLRGALKDARRTVAKTLRRRLGELDAGTFEKSVLRMLHALGFRETKVAKRSKEGPLMTSRKKEGSVDLRFAIRLCKGSPSVERKMVQDLRRDLSAHSAQVGLFICAGDVRGDARGEAQSSGPLVMLWCADALGEKFLESKIGVTVTQVEVFELDERFFEVAKVEAEDSQRRREERHRDRVPKEIAEPPQTVGLFPRTSHLTAAVVQKALPAELDEVRATTEPDSADGENESEEDLDAATAFVAGATTNGAPGDAQSAERKRRRRRRRGRRGRGQRPGEEGAAAGGALVAAVIAEGATSVADAPTSAPGSGVQEASAPPRPEPTHAPSQERSEVPEGTG